MTIDALVRAASEEGRGQPRLGHPATGEVGFSADECLKCNVCNTVCPVMRVTDRFPGPKYVGPQAQRFRLVTALPPQGKGVPAVPSPDLTVDYCSGCGLCTTACPAEVKIAEMNNRARATLRATQRPRLRDWLLGQTDLLGMLGTPVAPLANWVLRQPLLRRLVELTIGIHHQAPLPVYAGRTFRSIWREERRRHGGARSAEPGPDRAVVFFHGCAANYYEPGVARAAVAVLERNGFEVIVPPQVCCGLPMISNGRYRSARGKARRNVSVLADYARRGYRIVGTSTSCTHTLKAEYREMLDLSDDDATAVAEATWDICEFLLDLHEQGRLDTGFGRLEQELPYHAPCQLRSHGIGLPALDLFELVPGLRAIDYDHDCCGVAGTYGLKVEKYDIAMAVGEPLFRRLRASGASQAACDSETCRWQISAATQLPTRHPVEILAEAYAAGDAEAPGRGGAGAPARA
ncbi:MAG TPA: anaerobic glycerol-3-phosphate dehydrogenase subunit C [Candidatus Limnocylindrales bacterium]|nr:anaerobic glycerol-3-phosphate dehydrogenase subunit C [Candidatus Limnocylindrales bacterium]